MSDSTNASSQTDVAPSVDEITMTRDHAALVVGTILTIVNRYVDTCRRQLPRAVRRLEHRLPGAVPLSPDGGPRLPLTPHVAATVLDRSAVAPLQQDGSTLGLLHHLDDGFNARARIGAVWEPESMEPTISVDDGVGAELAGVFGRCVESSPAA